MTSFTENGAAVTAVAEPVDRRSGQPHPGRRHGVDRQRPSRATATCSAFSTAGTSITASYNAATETLVLSGVDTVAHYQSVLDSVTFTRPSDNPTNYGSNLSRVLTWVVNDGSASSNTERAAVHHRGGDGGERCADARRTFRRPCSSAIGQTLTVAPSASVADPDNLTLANATVKVTGGTFAGDGDVLAANVSGTSITASYNAATETLTLTGSDTLAHYQQVLDSVTFSSGANPTNSGANPTRTLTWTINDGAGSNNLSHGHHHHLDLRRR